MQAPPHWTRPRKWQLTRPLAFLLAAVFTDVVWEYNFFYTFMIFIDTEWQRTITATCHMVLRIFYFWGINLGPTILALPPRFLSLCKEEPLSELDDNGME